MPVSYTIDPARRMVVTRSSGVMTDADVIAIRAQFAADPAFDPQYAQLSDLRDLTDVALSASMIDAIASTSVFRPSTRRAFVAYTPFQFGIARMFAAVSEAHRQQVQVFRSMAEAESWVHQVQQGADVED
jgi:hypothetical protein